VNSLLLNARVKTINKRLMVAILAIMFALLIALIESGCEIDHTAPILNLYEKLKPWANSNRLPHG
jgi:hypothetical protein